MLGRGTCLYTCLGLIVLAGCTGLKGNTFEPANAGEVSPEDFVENVDNPYFPLRPGSIYWYETETDEGLEQIVVEVLEEEREVMGVPVTVVRDTVTLDGELVEDTYDWFAQDNQGNVWYLGEDVTNFEDGVFRDKAGSWEAGVDGALPGVIMYADPAASLGRPYRQEYDPGNAEDMAEVLSENASTTVPAGAFSGVVRTLDYTPLEPGVKEEKYYAPGIGLVRTVNLATGEVDILVEYFIP